MDSSIYIISFSLLKFQLSMQSDITLNGPIISHVSLQTHLTEAHNLFLRCVLRGITNQFFLQLCVRAIIPGDSFSFILSRITRLSQICTKFSRKYTRRKGFCEGFRRVVHTRAANPPRIYFILAHVRARHGIPTRARTEQAGNLRQDFDLRVNPIEDTPTKQGLAISLLQCLIPV